MKEPNIQEMVQLMRERAEKSKGIPELNFAVELSIFKLFLSIFHKGYKMGYQKRLKNEKTKGRD